MRNSELFGIGDGGVEKKILSLKKANRSHCELFGSIAIFAAKRTSISYQSSFLRSGTSIGANVKEAIRGQSKADFYAKMNISLKEASETEYWLELLHESGYIEKSRFSAFMRIAKS